MTFAETYTEEVIEARRARSKRARFWAKIVSLMLVLTLGATLRSEPQLRAALMTKGMDGVMALAGQPTNGARSDGAGFKTVQNWIKSANDQASLMKKVEQSQPEFAKATGTRHKVKVNRHKWDTGTGIFGGGKVPTQTASGERGTRNSTMKDTEAMAEDLGNQLSNMKPGG